MTGFDPSELSDKARQVRNSTTITFNLRIHLHSVRDPKIHLQIVHHSPFHSLKVG